MDRDFVQIEMFSAEDADLQEAQKEVRRQVNEYLDNYDARLVQSIQTNVTRIKDADGVVWTTITVTVALVC